MFDLINKKTGPIGLDIGPNSIKMIQLGYSSDKIRVIASDEARFGPALDADADGQAKREFAVSAIREMLSRTDFRGTNVVSCLSNDYLKIRSLRLDSSDTEHIDQLVLEEVAERFDFDSETDEIRYIVAGNVYQGDEIKNEVILFAVDKETIEGHIETLEESGLNPVGIDTIPCALFRCFQRSLRRQEDQHLVSVFVDVASHFTTVIIGRGRQIIFVKQIPLAGKQLNMAVASRLGMSVGEAAILRSKLGDSAAEEGIVPATKQAVIDAMSRVIEQLAKEVSLCFNYYAVTFRGKQLQEAFFTGGEAYEAALLNALKRHVGVEIKIAQPLRGFDMSMANFNSHEHCAMSEWAVAVGLSIKGWDLPDQVGENYERN